MFAWDLRVLRIKRNSVFKAKGKPYGEPEWESQLVFCHVTRCKAHADDSKQEHWQWPASSYLMCVTRPTLVASQNRSKIQQLCISFAIHNTRSSESMSGWHTADPIVRHQLRFTGKPGASDAKSSKILHDLNVLECYYSQGMNVKILPNLSVLECYYSQGAVRGT